MVSMADYKFNTYESPQLGGRRDFLKLFGVGAAIVPVIGSTPKMEAKARLIEEPKIELDVTGDVEAAIQETRSFQVLIIIAGEDGRQCRVKLRSTLESSPKSMRAPIPGLSMEPNSNEWTLKGRYLEEPVISLGDGASPQTFNRLPR
jgi:hypothetical protein